MDILKIFKGKVEQPMRFWTMREEVDGSFSLISPEGIKEQTNLPPPPFTNGTKNFAIYLDKRKRLEA